MTEVDVIIEISKGSHIKYEYDKERNILVCDRVLLTPMNYPFNYGFIPNTLSEDSDPLDAMVLMQDELLPGSLIRCKILGYLDTSDDEGNDPKLIVCPIEKIYPSRLNPKNIGEIDSITLNKISYFFKHYKDLENKKVVVNDFHNELEAEQIYLNAVKRFVYNVKTKILNSFN